MNIRKLKEAEAAFLARFPDGFADPGLARVRKSHNVERLAEYASANLSERAFSQPEHCIETLSMIVSRSSMVSRFEKPPFRRFIDSLSPAEEAGLADAFHDRLFGKTKRAGFEKIVALLAGHGLARWSIVSAVPFYFAPMTEVFVKPTTAKRIVAYLEVDELHYHARPDWRFYEGYRRLILDIKNEVDPSLTPNNAATTGFLMASM